MPENQPQKIKGIWSDYPKAPADEAVKMKNLAHTLLESDKGVIVEFEDVKTKEIITGRLFGGYLLVSEKGVMLVKYLPDKQHHHVEWAVPMDLTEEDKTKLASSRQKITN